MRVTAPATYRNMRCSLQTPSGVVATITEGDVEACNGMLHIIDTVLVPGMKSDTAEAPGATLNFTFSFHILPLMSCRVLPRHRMCNNAGLDCTHFRIPVYSRSGSRAQSSSTKKVGRVPSVVWGLVHNPFVPTC